MTPVKRPVKISWLIRDARLLNSFSIFYKNVTKLVFLWPNMSQISFKVLKTFKCNIHYQAFLMKIDKKRIIINLHIYCLLLSDVNMLIKAQQHKFTKL